MKTQSPYSETVKGSELGEEINGHDVSNFSVQTCVAELNFCYRGVSFTANVSVTGNTHRLLSLPAQICLLNCSPVTHYGH